MPIQSLQRGTITILDTTSQEDATITSVDTAKAIVHYIGAYAGTGIADSLCRIKLLNATTVRANRKTTGGGDDALINYEVVEFS